MGTLHTSLPAAIQRTTTTTTTIRLLPVEYSMGLISKNSVFPGLQSRHEFTQWSEEEHQ